MEWWSPEFGAALDVGGSGAEVLDGTLECYLGYSPSGATDRALHELQSYGSLLAISPSSTAMDSSPINYIIEEIIVPINQSITEFEVEIQFEIMQLFRARVAYTWSAFLEPICAR